MAVITEVIGTDTPNAGRGKWNTNFTNVNTELETASADILAHKTSDDHDGRYYTEGEVDSQIADVNASVGTVSDALVTHKTSDDHDGRYYTEDETDEKFAALSGATYTGDVTVKKALPSVGVATTNNEVRGRMTGYVMNGKNYFEIQMDESPEVGDPNYVPIIRVVKNDTDKLLHIPFRDVAAQGKKLATEEYVQKRVKTGNYVLTCANYTSLIGGDRYFPTFPDGVDKPYKFVIPENSIVRKASLAISGEDVNYAHVFDFDVYYAFVNIGSVNETMRVLRPLVKVNDEGGGNVSFLFLLDAGEVKNDLLEWTTVFESASTISFPAGTYTVYLSLMCSI